MTTPAARTRRGRGLLLPALLLASPAHGAIAQRSEAAGDVALFRSRIDRYFDGVVANGDFAGAVLVARGARVLVDTAYGVIDPERGTPASPRDRFRVASITKTFTAAAVAMLAEQGKLRLDDPLARFLPEFPNAERITVLQLLRHESGLANPDEREAFTRQSITLPDLVAHIGARPPLFAPGTQNRYSNAGYSVLARVIEVASGESYDAFLERRIFGPLGMTATSNDDDGRARVRGHSPGPPPSGRVPAMRTAPGFETGSGSIVSSTGDLLRWARAIHGQQLFDREALAYPYGWGRLGADRRGGLDQTGLGNGFTSSLAVWFPDSLYVVILGNVETAGWTQWSADVAAMARGEERAPPPPRTEVAISPAASRLVGEYVGTAFGLTVEERAGSLWVRLGDSPVPRYLTPVGPAEFELRSSGGRLRFDVKGQGRATQATWIFGPTSRYDFRRSDGT